ncbi:Aldo/keto reductase [Exidia glandulosa HHB12029]|uniref:Aldo/keto reductase n=1 Tax=Exidia glandulosa HHB12029 TaxID=1314781 RepID=A0A165KVZ9_EXIGL|nr:Aldo/keto reductase [Exidia glandulosa HHB12029]
MVKTTHLGGTASNIVTPVIGHGLMLMTARASAVPDEQCFESIKATINALPPGAKAFPNSGDFYGYPPNLNGNLDLVKRYFDKYPEDKEKVFISVKGALDMPGHVPNSSPESLRTGVDNIIAKLGGKKLDLFQPARVDKKYPIEDTMKFLAQLVKEGKFDHIGLSEISADTLRRAHAIHPVSVVEIEVSPWSYDDHCKAVIALAKELGVAIAAYSPLGHGALTGAIKKVSDIPEGDFRRNLQRFQEENLAHNMGIVDKITAVAEKKKVTPGQLSLAWVCSRGEHVIPIPGSSHAKRTLENTAACDITLTPEEIKEIDEIIASHTMIGGRYFGNPEAENLSI